MDERKLYSLKWFEYRPYDPQTATLMFIRAWGRESVRHNAKIGRFPVVFATYKTFDPVKLVKTRRWKIHNILRQWSDAQGMPYEKFWEWAFMAHLLCKFKYQNEINFTKDSVLTRVKSEWEQYKVDFIHLSDNWLLQPDNYHGYAFQNEYYCYLIGEIVNRYHSSSWTNTILGYVNDDRIPKNFLKSNYIQHLLNRRA